MINLKNKRIIIFFIVMITLIFIGRYLWISNYSAGEIATLSISSDGRYVISGDTKNLVILWDIKNKTKKIISRDGNMYSTYWVKNTDNFIWQDLSNQRVHIQNSSGQEIDHFKPGFLVFGEAMTSDLNYLIASDQYWNLYIFDMKAMYRHKIAHYYDDADFEGANKVVNFMMLENDKVLSSGMPSPNPDNLKYATGVQLWSLNTFKSIHNYIGNSTQTFATISPDGQYIVSGDNGSWLFVWETLSGKRIVSILTDQPILKTNADGSITEDKNVLPIPTDFIDDHGYASSFSILSVKFIDATHYLRFTLSVPYAMLYEVTNPKALKYIPLGRHPYPAVDYYARDQAIDTAPDAHILVMAKENEGGILVYQYDPQTQTLTKVWNGK